MEKYIINGQNKLFGKVKISSAKNACLPIIASTIMFSGEFLLLNAPNISDVLVMAEIIKDLGGNFQFDKKGLLLKTCDIKGYAPSEDICVRARASFFTVGALLSRFKRAVLPLPGGCKIGARPVDVHLDVFNQLGVESKIEGNLVVFDGSKIKSGSVHLKLPSVGATVNAICACVGLKGESIITNCAKEPEIVDLCNFLKRCGAQIVGEGSSTIKIRGIVLKSNLTVDYQPIEDRIEAGTFLFATAVAGGEISFKYNDYCHICSVAKLLDQMGAKICYERKNVHIRVNQRLKAVNAVADVFPAFPTDLQSPLCALCCYADGESVIADRVFKDRFGFVKQLSDFGVRAKVLSNRAFINGKEINDCCKAEALDLRAGAGLVIYSLGARGQSQISGIEMIRRGYENFDKKLRLLGADMRYILS